MTPINIAMLIAAGIAPTQARVFAAPLQPACTRFEINTPARLAAFLAQCSYESEGFTKLEEGLFYRTPGRIGDVFQRLRPLGNAELTKLCRNPQALANKAYANINGNGNEASGDGWRYRGRGLIGITGRANYRAADAAMATSFELLPDLVAQPNNAALTAAWFFASNGCNALADSSQIDAITRRVNGPAMLAKDDRRSMFDDAMRALA